MTVKQAAALMDVSPSLIYDLCRLGKIRHSRHGRPGKRGTIRIEDAALEEYREACRHESTPPPLKHIS